MRAREPDTEGYVERAGVKLFYEVFGEGHEPTLLLMPTCRAGRSVFPNLCRPRRGYSDPPAADSSSNTWELPRRSWWPGAAP